MTISILALWDNEDQILWDNGDIMFVDEMTVEAETASKVIVIEAQAAVNTDGDLETFYLSDEEYTTTPTDTLPSTSFMDRLIDPGSIGVYAFSDGRTGGVSKLDLGEIIVANADGELDAWAGYGFGGRRITIKSGLIGAVYSSFQEVFAGTIEAADTGYDQMVLRLRDRSYVLDAPLLTDRYLGNNALPFGIEGTEADLKGKVKPRLFGKGLNIPAPCVNTSELVYQISAGKRENLLKRSDDFSHSDWTKDDLTVTANAEVAPDGSLTADKLVPDAGGGDHNVTQLVPYGSTEVYVAFSAYLKAGEYNWAYLEGDAATWWGTARAFINLATGELGTVDGFPFLPGLAVEDVGGGWYRLSVIFTGDTGGLVTIGVADQDNDTTFTADGTSGIYVWGAQAERFNAAVADPRPTTYIPTTSAAVTVAALDSVEAVYDRGVALAFDADYATVALLLTASPSAGEYATCLNEGLCKLGATPDGLVTADATQGNDAADRTTAQLLKALAMQVGVRSTNIVATDVTALDADNAAVVGVWVDSEGSARSVMDEIAASIGAWYGFDGQGRLRMGRLTAPSGTGVATFDEDSIVGNVEVRSPADYPDPVRSATVRHTKIWAVQTSDLAGSVSDDRRAFLAQETRSVAAEDINILAQFPLAGAMEVTGLLTAEADAQTEADRLLALHGVKRLIYDVPVPLDAVLGSEIGLTSTVELDLPRFALDGGVPLRVLGINYELKDRTAILQLWG